MRKTSVALLLLTCLVVFGDGIKPVDPNATPPGPPAPSQVTITEETYDPPVQDPQYPAFMWIKLSYSITLSGDGGPPWQNLVGRVMWDNSETALCQDFNITPVGSLAQGEVWICVSKPGPWFICLQIRDLATNVLVTSAGQTIYP